MKKLITLFCISLLLMECAGNRNAGKLSFISIQEELNMGQEFAAQAAQKLKIIRNQQISDYFTEIGKAIGSQSDWSGLVYKIYIVNSPDVNHFSLPGGNIYIFRGLIEASDSLDEVALAIAHEIGHICSRDGVERLAAKYGYAFAAQSVVGSNPEIPGQIVDNLYRAGTILDYSKESEYRADLQAIKFAQKAGYDAHGWLLFLQTLKELQVKNSAKLNLLLTTHPSITARLRRVRKELQKTPQMQQLVRNTPQYQKIKTLLQRIPY
jgi:beta-barrel assembly-enhancing protease